LPAGKMPAPRSGSWWAARRGPAAAAAAICASRECDMNELACDESISFRDDDRPPSTTLSLAVLSPRPAGCGSTHEPVSGAPPSVPPSPGHLPPRPAAAPRARTTPRTRTFRKACFPDVADKEWNDWRWQTRKRVRSLADLEKMLVLSQDERDALRQGGSMLPV